MSLKAKIEAVIYASEEPVTLAQLTGLLGQEAQVELDHLDSAQQSLSLHEDSPSEIEAEVAEITESYAEAQGIVLEQLEPASTDPAPSHEPEPTEDSPTPELPTRELSGDAAGSKVIKQDERARDRRLREHFRSILEELIADYAASDRGLEIREVAGGYRFSTKPEYHDAVRGFVKSLKPPLKLSLQALETLAVVAYKQPVTGPEISEIRGVDSGGVLGSLMARKLITTAGRKQVIGRPILYRTTRDFLLRFGLRDVSELPSIEEFEKMAGDLADIEPVQEEIPMPDTKDNFTDLPAESTEEGSDSVGPQADGTSIPLEGSDESVTGAPDDTAAIEILTGGRISGVPPKYDQESGNAIPLDSSAMDAELQREEAAEEGVLK